MKDDSNEGNHKITLTGDFGHFISNQLSQGGPDRYQKAAYLNRASKTKPIVIIY